MDIVALIDIAVQKPDNSTFSHDVESDISPSPQN
jgi:hypothetical protein